MVQIRQLSIGLTVATALGVTACGDRGIAVSRSAAPESKAGTVSQALTPSHAELLIVTDDALAPALEPLLNHKNSIGIPTGMVRMSAVTASCTGAYDDAECLKEYLASAYTNSRTRYVLLAGDATHVPVRYWSVVNTSNTGTYPPGVSYHVTDFYYANLFKDHDGYGNSPNHVFASWDDNGNHFFNEQHFASDALSYNPDDVDAYADIAVGRVPAHSTSDMTDFVNKVINYESWPQQSSNSAALFDDYPYEQTPGFITQVEQGLQTPTTRNSHIVVQVPSNVTPKSPWTAGQPSNIISAANTFPWMFYVGHGGPDGWGSPIMSLDPTTCSNTTNYPVVAATGCQTAEFAPDQGYPHTFPGTFEIVSRPATDAGSPPDAGSAQSSFLGYVAMAEQQAQVQLLSPSCATTSTGACAPIIASTGSFWLHHMDVGDFNGDGLTDLLAWDDINDAAAGSVWVKIQDPNASMTTPGFDAPTQWGSDPSFFSGVASIAADVGRVSGEPAGSHRTDLVSWNSNSIWVALSNGTGGFTAKQEWSTNTPFSGDTANLAADLNNDGFADLIEWNANSKRVMLSNGANAFGAPQTWSSGVNFVGRLANLAADVNDDHYADLIAWDTSTSVWVMLSTTTGCPAGVSRCFGAPHQWSSNNFSGVEAAFAMDVNGDGASDLVAVNDTNATVELSTDQGFGAPQTYASSAVTLYSKPGDYPVAWTPGADPIWPGTSFASPWLLQSSGAIAYAGGVLVAPSNWEATFLSELANRESAGVTVLGDAWRQAQLMYRATNATTSDTIGSPRIFLSEYLLFGDPSLRLQYSAGRYPGLIAFDTNVWTEPMSVACASTPTAANCTPTNVSSGVSGTAATLAADVNGDGLTDIVALNSNSVNAIQVETQGITSSQGARSFSALSTWWSGTIAFGDTLNTAADVNGDGADDIVIWNKNSKYVIPGARGATSFALESPWSSENFAGSVANLTGDVNGDGKADLIAWTTGSSNIWVELSTGAKFLTSTSWYTQAMLTGDTANLAGDVDGDGCADLIIWNATLISVALSNCSNSFATPVQWYNGSVTTFKGDKGNVAFDVNGDGMVDLVAITDNAAWVLLSTRTNFGAAVGPTQYSANAFAGKFGTVAANFVAIQ